MTAGRINGPLDLFCILTVALPDRFLCFPPAQVYAWIYEYAHTNMHEIEEDTF